MLKHIIKYVRLFALRVLMLVGTSVAILWCRVTRNPDTKRLELPLFWLRHYLAGTGKPLEVPEVAMVEAIPVFYRGIDIDAYGDLANRECLNGSRFCVTSSVLYEGSGFYGRPVLFYLVGGFTFRVQSRIEDGKLEVLAKGEDTYDWHATPDRDGNPQYFTSPLGTGTLAYGVVKALGFLFGEEYFTTDGWPLGEVGISNRLWDDLHLVGARAFRTNFQASIVRNADDEEAFNYIARTSVGYCYSRRVEAWCRHWGLRWYVRNRVVDAATQIHGLTGELPEIDTLVSEEEFKAGLGGRVEWFTNHHCPDEGKNMPYWKCVRRFIAINYRLEEGVFATPQHLTMQRIIG